MLNALQACATSFDNPARQALIPRLVPIANLPGALALNLTMFQVAIIAGPAFAGALLASLGSLSWFAADGGASAVGVLYSLNAVSFLFVLGALARIRTSTAPDDVDGPRDDPVAALLSGLRFVFTTPLMVWTMGLDFVATFFSGAMSLLPIFADQILKVGPAGYGWLAAAPAIGALLGSLYTSVRPPAAPPGPGAAVGGRRVRRRHGRVRLVALVRADVRCAGGHRPRRRRLDRDPPDAAPAHHARRAARPHDLRQHDLLHGRPAARRAGGRPRRVQVRVGRLGVTVSIVAGGTITLLAVAAIAIATPLVRRYEGPG